MLDHDSLELHLDLGQVVLLPVPGRVDLLHRDRGLLGLEKNAFISTMDGRTVGPLGLLERRRSNRLAIYGAEYE